MKRPSPAGLLIALAIAIPVLIELRTVLVWIGIDVPLGLYASGAVAVVLAVGGAVWFLGEEEQSRRA